MGYVASMNGLGAWYNPASWFGDDAPAGPDPKALEEGGKVRYAKQLYQYSRQMRTWLYARRAERVNDPAGYAKCTEALNKLVALDNSLAPIMQKIADAERKANEQYRLPADWGFRWTGWEGTATTAPTPPPAPTPLTAAEAQQEGTPSYAMYALGAILVAAGVFLILTGVGSPLGALLFIVAGIGAATIGTPGVQDMFRNAAPEFGKNLGKEMGKSVLWLGLVGIGLYLFTAKGE
jgi:hypothetical protein